MRYVRPALLSCLCALGVMSSAAAAAGVSVGPASGAPGSTVLLPVTMADADQLFALEFSLAVDPARLHVTAVTLGPVTAGFAMAWHEEKGICRIALASGTPVKRASGVVAFVTVEISKEAPAGDVVVSISRILVNDAPVEGQGGVVTVTGTAAQSRTRLP